ncbi:hypothetical protein PHYPSEUDO_005082 [Phytophthora pseudosyringae]|uniref:Uncharacterized protein n=1 Tax=Phytophthora pseudosyringae TaxID=221518 RepID=A0A8T1VQH0_9STRA|nr:hypothetical protein PHYPSEUDO_005082 [Phytophthora pseudosyringae]
MVSCGLSRCRCDPVNCVVSGWSTYGSCDTSTGLKTRRRGIPQKDTYGGFYSPETTNTEPCETVDCVTNDFVPWSAWDAITGSKTRSRTVRVFIVYGGCTCLDSSGIATGGTIVN